MGGAGFEVKDWELLLDTLQVRCLIRALAGRYRVGRVEQNTGERSELEI